MKLSTFFAVTLLSTYSLFLLGCNTVRGFGEDISGSANYVEKKISGDDTTSSNPPQWPKQ